MGEIVKSKGRVYLGGPMQRIKDFNFPAFDKAAAFGRLKGWEVISPAEHNRACGFDETKNTLDGFDLKAAQKWDLEQISQCDAIALLSGWESSTGANTELVVAKWFGCKVLDATTFEEFTQASRKDRSVVDEARKLVHGERNIAYGNPANDFSRTAGMLTGLYTEEIKRRLAADEPIFQPVDIPRIQVCVKLSRTIQSPTKRDHYVDIAGYAETADWTVNG